MNDVRKPAEGGFRPTTGALSSFLFSILPTAYWPRSRAVHWKTEISGSRKGLGGRRTVSQGFFGALGPRAVETFR